MKYERVLRSVTVATLLLALVSISGCVNTSLFLIDGEDIMAIDKGTVIQQPDGVSRTVDRDGWFVSDFYVEKIMEAKVE